MNRRRFVSAAALTGAAVLTSTRADAALGAARSAPGIPNGWAGTSIPVAFVISDKANVMDLAGPWEVFQDTIAGEGENRTTFRLYTVAESTAPLRATGGLQLIPHYTIEDAPTPSIIVVGAQRGSPALHAWLREMSPRAEQLVSVCTGAFQLGRAGLLDGLAATTHHEFWDLFEEEFSRVQLVRGPRYVDAGRVLSAGGLTSGIDVALHVVHRRLGLDVAQRTADYMEHRSTEWR